MRKAGVASRVAAAGVAATVSMMSLVTMAGPAAAHGSCRGPAVERVSEVTASRRVSCATARRVAEGYDRRVMASEQFPGGDRVAVGRFSCATRPAPNQEETFKVRCSARGGDVVRFSWGV